jgi:hypothetical protein
MERGSCLAAAAESPSGVWRLEIEGLGVGASGDIEPDPRGGTAAASGRISVRDGEH